MCLFFLLLSSSNLDVYEFSLLLAFVLPRLYFFFFPPLLEFDDSELSSELVLDEDSLSSVLSLPFFFLIYTFKALAIRSSKDSVALVTSAFFNFLLLLPFRNHALRFLSVVTLTALLSPSVFLHTS